MSGRGAIAHPAYNPGVSPHPHSKEIWMGTWSHWPSGNDSADDRAYRLQESDQRESSVLALPSAVAAR